MKRLFLLTLVVAFCSTMNAQSLDKFIGNWKFNATTGEYGYESGMVDIEKDKVIMTFTGDDYKYPSDWVKYESDTLKYNFYVESTVYVKCYLVVKDAANLEGYAVWDEGESKLILTKEKLQ